MTPDNNRFKLILTAIFGFFIVLGLVVFATYKASSSTDSNVTISIWGTVDQTTFNSFIAAYEQNADVELKVNYTEVDPSTFNNQVLEAIAAGTAPDVILIPQEFMDEYLNKVTFITSIPTRTFENTYIQEANLYLQPNGIFAIPFFVDPMVMYWNKDTFASNAIAEPPANWSDFPLLASALSKSDASGNITASAVALGGYANIDNAKALLSTLIMQAGSPIVSEDASGNLTSALYNNMGSSSIEVPAVSVLDFFTDYSNPDKAVYSWNDSLPDSESDFVAGNLATYFGFASDAQDIANKNPNLNFDVAEMPQTVDAQTAVTFGELYGFAFLKSSPNTVAAFNLITTLTSAQAVNTFLQYMDVAPARRDLIATGTPDPQKTVFYDSALIAQGWIDPNPTQTDQIFQTMVESVTTGETDSDTAVQNASAQLGTLLQQPL